MQCVTKYNSSYTFLLVLVGSCICRAEADSFMDNWLARQKSQAQGGSFTEQVASQAASQVASFSQGFAQQVGSVHSAPDDVFSQPRLEGGKWVADSGASWEADDALEQSLLSDIEEAIGTDQRRLMEVRITAIEKLMQPMFQALPKNQYDKLDHPSVRYMLHRFFVQEHGWFIDGLFTAGAALNTSSPSGALKNRVPMFVQGLFDKRLSGRGFGMHESAVIVAVVENSVHQEAQTALKATYKALSLPLNRSFDVEKVDKLVQIYMSGFVMSTNMSSVSARYLAHQWATMGSRYPTWPRAQEFFENVRKSHASDSALLSFSEVSVIVQEVVDTFGTFQGKQCQGLKASLTSLERKGSAGCVNLPDFYEKGLKADSNWMFVESPEYLRQIGVLDEADPKHPHVLTANYINSPTNCLQPTGYYLVCCHNECDDILSQLEQQLGKPAATPTEIVKALRAASGSASSLRAGSVAPSLRRRLQEVAESHDGQVPIHGRLFAQWLHHVFPHECPYPHLSGSKHQQYVDDFEKETGKFASLTDEEMASWVANTSDTLAVKATKTLSADVGSCAPWAHEEELFASIPHARPLRELENDPHLWNISGGIAFVAAAVTFFITMMRTCKTMTKIRYQPKMLLV